jgi:hypothetical protein
MAVMTLTAQFYQITMNVAAKEDDRRTADNYALLKNVGFWGILSYGFLKIRNTLQDRLVSDLQKVVARFTIGDEVPEQVLSGPEKEFIRKNTITPEMVNSVVKWERKEQEEEIRQQTFTV